MNWPPVPICQPPRGCGDSCPVLEEVFTTVYLIFEDLYKYLQAESFFLNSPLKVINSLSKKLRTETFEASMSVSLPTKYQSGRRRTNLKNIMSVKEYVLIY